MTLVESFAAETIRLMNGFSITRADCYAAYIAAGHDARTADQFAFGYTRRCSSPIHKKAFEIQVATLCNDRAALASIFA